MKARGIIAVIAMVGGGLLALATPAAATPSTFGALVPSSFVESYALDDVPASTVQDGVAQCPAGMSAVSVGGGASLLDSLTPGPGGTSGISTVRTERQDTRALVSAQATCAPNAQFAGTTTATRHEYRHSVSGEWTATVTCPAGMRAFGGGGYFETAHGAVSKDNYFMAANSVTVNGRGWTMSGLDPTFTDRLVVTTRCAVQSTSTRLVEEIYPIVPITGATVGRANGYAHCPAGYLPISGGAQITQDGYPVAAQPQLEWSVSVRTGQVGWYAAGWSGGSNAQLHVIALCGI